MDRGNWWTRLVIVVAVTLGSLWFLVPTYYSFFVLPEAHRNNVKKLRRLPPVGAGARYRLNLGLDLQGGIHMVMRVDTKTALKKRVERRGAADRELPQGEEAGRGHARRRIPRRSS